MEKKRYNSPLMEVETISLSSSILTESPTPVVPPHPSPKNGALIPFN